MASRLVLTLLICLVTLAAFVLFQAWQRRLLSQVAVAGLVPRLLYFRSDSCASCAAQAHALTIIGRKSPIHIETIDAVNEPDTAARYNIMTLPTTILLAADGTVQHINYGLADDRKLSRQLESLL